MIAGLVCPSKTPVTTCTSLARPEPASRRCWPRLILQDAAAGRSVVVVEPKGGLIEDVLARIPPVRIDDVVVIEPSEREYPVGLNPLQPHGRNPELIADQVLAVFHGLWSSNWGPRLQDILHSSPLTLAGREDASLCLLPALLTNPPVRQRLRSGIDDPMGLEAVLGLVRWPV
jgi:hypothetical protein